MTDRYAVIGRPISHTKSPLIHGLYAEATGQDIAYGAIEGSLDHFADDVRGFRDEGGRGMNITAPFKMQAFELADSRSARATLAKASNCLKFENGKIFAENYDGIGLLRDIQSNLKTPLAGRRLLILGAGGAVRGAILPFLEAGPAQVVVVNRDVTKAQALAIEVNNPLLTVLGYDDLAGQTFDVVVNATSASLMGECPPIHGDVFKDVQLAYELAYGKGLTPFLRLARESGVKAIADGVGMLVEQAAEAFEWWRGVRPDTRPVIDRLTVPLV
ncbi:shikimate dehydrogenase [Pseudomonas sp. dw_358]|uniref:shikimate dehydrogenase n=1 Tax=Pseudomonas sp. dw_358 TaxID=2720083 RepID=UPI001BD329F4|nr:shikimate dehydrogenase [Pseudomonas sp. dw_358]